MEFKAPSRLILKLCLMTNLSWRTPCMESFFPIGKLILFNKKSAKDLAGWSHETQRRYDGYFKCREVKTGFCRNRSMQTGSSGTLIGWISGQTTFVPLWDRMEGAWLRTQYTVQTHDNCGRSKQTPKTVEANIENILNFPPNLRNVFGLVCSRSAFESK